MQLARAEGSPHRFYSMSAEIQWRHKSYYDILKNPRRAVEISRPGGVVSGGP